MRIKTIKISVNCAEMEMVIKSYISFLYAEGDTIDTIQCDTIADYMQKLRGSFRTKNYRLYSIFFIPNPSV